MTSPHRPRHLPHIGLAVPLHRDLIPRLDHLFSPGLDQPPVLLERHVLLVHLVQPPSHGLLALLDRLLLDNRRCCAGDELAAAEYIVF